MIALVFVMLSYFTQSIEARHARTIYLDDKKTESVSVITGHTTILSFPTRPTKVIVGNKGLFAVEYVEADLAVTALTSSARSNLFVYLEGRRFGFDLIAVSMGGDEIVLVRDRSEKKINVKPRVKYE